jgi:hypothetical protein
VLPVASLIGSMDVRRQGHVPKLFDPGEKVGNGSESYCAFPEFAMLSHFRLQLVRCAFAEADGFAGTDLASGPNKAFPGGRIGRDLLGQQHLDATMQEVAHGGILGAKRLRMESGAVSEEAGGDDTRVVQDEQVIGPQEAWKIPELRVAELTGNPPQAEHSSRSPVHERLLCDQFFWELEVEIRDEHTTIIGSAEKITSVWRFELAKRESLRYYTQTARPSLQIFRGSTVVL